MARRGRVGCEDGASIAGGCFRGWGTNEMMTRRFARLANPWMSYRTSFTAAHIHFYSIFSDLRVNSAAVPPSARADVPRSSASTSTLWGPPCKPGCARLSGFTLLPHGRRLQDLLLPCVLLLLTSPYTPPTLLRPLPSPGTQLQPLPASLADSFCDMASCIAPWARTPTTRRSD